MNESLLSFIRYFNVLISLTAVSVVNGFMNERNTCI